MDQKFKNSLVLGKFFPPHLGHLYLIDTALNNSEVVHVVVCHNSTQNIPGQVRVDTLKGIYKDRIKIYLLDDGHLPQSDTECSSKDEFYALWIPEVYSLIKDLDVVFTSEDYGDDFAKYLGVDHFLVDKNREEYPISGTQIRADPHTHWEFIPEAIRPFFIKRIAIVGPESVGKSILTKYISNYFKTNFVEEYGRHVYESNGNQVSLKDFIPISKGRQDIENWMIKSSNKLIFCDTEDITTYIFSKMYCPDEYQSIEAWLLDQISSKPKYDLYILLKTDCESKQDGTRNFLHQRETHYQEIKSELIKNGCDFVEIGGDWMERYKKSIQIIKSKFNI